MGEDCKRIEEVDAMTDVSRWFEDMTYSEAKAILQENMTNMKMSFIAAGYYLKYIRDRELFREDGYESIWEFAEDNYGIKKSTASRWMAMNDKFSQGGNSPSLAEEYKGFEKSQLQEMLYLDDKQIESVTPDMTVRDIREVRKPDPVSAYGTKRRVYQEGSLIKTAGCEGGHDCFMCGQYCLIRGEDRHCKDAPTGNPFPCEMIDSIPALRNSIGERCLFVNLDLADHYPTGDARPCCEDCKDPCSMECDRAFFARGEKAEDDSADNEGTVVATSQQDEEQLPGQMSVEDFPELLPDQNDLKEETSEKSEVEKTHGEIVESEFVDNETDHNESRENEKFEELSDQTDAELLRDLLNQAKDRLSLLLEEFSENDIRVRKQKLIIGAYAGMIADIDLYADQNREQPELPKLRNNDQRKAFLNNYREWPVWFRVNEASEVYYRYDIPDGSSIVICEYHFYLPWLSKDQDRTGTREYLLKPGYHYLEDCKTNTTTLVEHLKNIQKEAKEDADRC